MRCAPPSAELDLGQPFRLPVRVLGPARRSAGEVYGRRLGDPGQARKVLFCHGVGIAWSTWRQVLPLVAPYADCVAIDELGFGRSPAESGSDLTMAGQTRVLEAVLDGLRWREVIVVGHSMGGGMALGAALHWPRRVRGVVQVCGVSVAQPIPGLFWLFHLPFAAEAMALGARWSLSRGGPEYLHERFGYDLPAARDFLDCLRQWSVSRHFVTAACDLKTAHYRQFMSRFGELRQPTLIIHGGRDDIVPPDVPARLDRILPDSELHWIARAGHMPQESHPAAVGAALVEFLTTRFPTVEEKA